MYVQRCGDEERTAQPVLWLTTGPDFTGPVLQLVKRNGDLLSIQKPKMLIGDGFHAVLALHGLCPQG